MTVDTIARATVEQEIVDQASAIYAEVGMTIDQAFRQLLVRTVEKQAVPFEAFTPNRDTIEAMEAGRRGEVTRVNSVDELFEHLHAED